MSLSAATFAIQIGRAAQGSARIPSWPGASLVPVVDRDGAYWAREASLTDATTLPLDAEGWPKSVLVSWFYKRDYGVDAVAPDSFITDRARMRAPDDDREQVVAVYADGAWQAAGRADAYRQLVDVAREDWPEPAVTYLEQRDPSTWPCWEELVGALRPGWSADTVALWLGVGWTRRRRQDTNPVRARGWTLDIPDDWQSTLHPAYRVFIAGDDWLPGYRTLQQSANSTGDLWGRPIDLELRAHRFYREYHEPRIDGPGILAALHDMAYEGRQEAVTAARAIEIWSAHLDGRPFEPANAGLTWPKVGRLPLGVAPLEQRVKRGGPATMSPSEKEDSVIGWYALLGSLGRLADSVDEVLVHERPPGAQGIAAVRTALDEVADDYANVEQLCRWLA